MFVCKANICLIIYVCMLMLLNYICIVGHPDEESVFVTPIAYLISYISNSG